MASFGSSILLKLMSLSIHTDIDEIELGIDKTMLLNLILNELILNSLKHAFQDTIDPCIVIQIRRDSNKIILKYSDNGLGFDNSVFSQSSSIGMKIVNSLVIQLDGKLDLKSSENTGTTYTIVF